MQRCGGGLGKQRPLPPRGEGGRKDKCPRGAFDLTALPNSLASCLRKPGPEGTVCPCEKSLLLKNVRTVYSRSR